jgi:retron-type reverse transcriptase
MFSFIENFISERIFQVKVGSELSETKVLENGTPQGSIISPVLFPIMINDMVDSLGCEHSPNQDAIYYFN